MRNLNVNGRMSLDWSKNNHGFDLGWLLGLHIEKHKRYENFWNAHMSLEIDGMRWTVLDYMDELRGLPFKIINTLRLLDLT